MDWDRVSINIFEGQAFSYVAWLDKAHGLHESAKLLEPRIQKFWDVLQGQQAMLSTPAEPEHIHATYFMLAAYSCENLLKAALIMRNVVRYKDEFQQTKRFPKDLQSHDLFKLACMLWVSGWRDSLRTRPRQRTDSFEISPAPPSNVDQELSGVLPCGTTTTDLKASQRGWWAAPRRDKLSNRRCNHARARCLYRSGRLQG